MRDATADGETKKLHFAVAREIDRRLKINWQPDTATRYLEAWRLATKARNLRYRRSCRKTWSSMRATTTISSFHAGATSTA